MNNIPILVVEDDILASLETCDALRDYGFNVLQVDGARGAFQILDRQAPLLALITDINLGAGADGYEIAHIARTAYPQLPVIYCSASSADRQITEGVEGSAFIAKPFNTRHVVETLIRMLYLQDGSRAA